MIEIWLPRSVWVRANKPYFTTNYELYDGKPRNPEVDGGYHAIRFPTLEALNRRRRQAIVIAIREVTPSYYAPVGSWQIRESVRRAFTNKPVKFSSLEEALKVVNKFIETPIDLIIAKSKLLKSLLLQRKLIDFLDYRR